MFDEEASAMKQLPASTVRLITSTQVITSVYSVIKELIENSLDAGATNIEIKLENYGLDKIELRDNGSGIKRTDTKWMAQPHYTSKITDHNDLDKLLTYGFRGEALGALSAVCELVITTKTTDDDLGMTYTLDKTGQVKSSKPSCLGEGTTVTVNNLFKNLPVRKQFYSTAKKKKEELKKVEDVIMAFGIIHPGIRFWVRHNKETIWQKGFQTNHRNVLMGILGINANMTIEAFLPSKDSSSQVTSRAVNDRMFCYINKRPVTVKQVEKLLKQYYVHGMRCENNRHPIGFISITVPPEGVDVNLDPNKQTVLLHDQEKVCDLLEKILLKVYGPLKKPEEDKNLDKLHGVSCLDDTIEGSTASESECDSFSNKTDKRPRNDRREFQIPKSRNRADFSAPKNLEVAENSLEDKNDTISLINESNNNNLRSSEQTVHPELDAESCPDIFADGFFDDWEPSLSFDRLKTDDNTSSTGITDTGGNNTDRSLHINQNENNQSLLSKELPTMENTGRASQNLTTPPLIIVNHHSEDSDRSDPAPVNIVQSSRINPSSPVSNNLSVLTPENSGASNTFNVTAETSSTVFDKSWSTGRVLDKSVQPVKLLTPGYIPLKNQTYLSPSGSCITPTPSSGENNRSKKQTKSASSAKRKSLWDNSTNQSKLFDVIREKPNRKPLTAFEIYVKENKQRALAENPEIGDDDDCSLIKMMEDEWRILSADDRFEFEAKEIKEREMFWKRSMEIKKPEIREREKSPGIDYHIVKKRRVEDVEIPSKSSASYLSEKPIQFSMNDLRRKFKIGLCSQYTQSRCIDKQPGRSEPIGDLKSVNLWAVSHGDEVFVINHWRVQETITFQHLLLNHKIVADVLLDPITLVKRMYGDKPILWDTLCSLPCRLLPGKPWPMLIDDRLTNNGFIIHKISGSGCASDVETTFQITSTAGCIPGYGVNDLNSILEAINRSESSTGSQCRPPKVIEYLKSEAVRMARQLPKHLSREDVRTLIHEMDSVLPAGVNKCLHDKPLYQQMYDMSNIPMSQVPK
ncbi:PMS1 protein homolog 1-like [Tubulanus polymorphus]|uniref:PMS1 protein homolog 1-like n=1 Tax=Tubulanus polymorphus TaxID=672921 RepID=UPI003DA29CE4